MSRVVVTLPASESAWKCNRCEHIFDKGLEMCPQCTSISVTEVRMAKTRRGQVEAEEAALQAQTPEDTPEGGDGAPDSPPDPNGDGAGPYDGWTKRELQAECEKRGLSRSGNMHDLTDRLVEHDQAQAGTEADAG
jgi:hypothetical protein